jgi:hypothetical protein
VKIAFRESFARDLKGLRDKRLLKRVREAIEAVEGAGSLTELTNLRKLKGTRLRTLGLHRPDTCT